MTRTLLTLILAVLLLPTASLGQTPPGDHYLCYKAAQSKGETKLGPSPKLLIDQFQNQSYDVTKVVSLCNPATKTHNAITTTPQFPAVHQQGYQIKPPKGAPKFVASDHTVFDQFGSLQLTVKSPASLLVRAGKTVLGSDLPACKLSSDCAPGLACIGGACIDPAFPTAPADNVGVDNYKCYKVAIQKGAPKFVPIVGGLVEVTDQFGGPFKVEIAKPTKLCTPVDKAGENPGAETHVGHLMCYQAKLTKTDPAQARFVKTRVAVANTNFPDTRLDAKSLAELCVPAFKDAIPTPTPITPTPTPTPTTTLPPCEGDPDFPETGAGWPACGGSCPDPNDVCQAYTYELTLGQTTRGCACVPTGSVCGPSDLPPTPGCSAACTLGFSLAPTLGACPSGSACMADEGLSQCTNLYDPSDGTCTPIADFGFFFKKYRCRVPETACGNGIVETPFVGTPEQCDDGNAVEGDGCSTTCQFNFCGNGTIEPGEQCDDGNVTSGDGCSFLCQLGEFEGCNVTGTWSGEIFGVHDWTFIEAPNGAVTGVSWYRATPASVSPVTGSRSGSGLELVALGGVSLTGTLTTCDAMTLLSDFFPIEIVRVRNDYCGDGALAPAYEACDDGNLAPGDGCSPSCATNG